MTKNASLYFDSLEDAQAYQATLQTARVPESTPLYFDSLEDAQAYQATLLDAQPPQAGSAPESVNPLTLDPSYDSMGAATGKALRNVPERFEQSVGGLARMLGEDMSADKARYVRDRARQAGLSVDDYTLITDALHSGKIDKVGNVQDTLKQLKAGGYQGHEGMDVPEKIADFGTFMGERAQESMIPVNAEPDSAAHYVSSAIGSLAEMVPALAASIVTRKPGPALATLSGQVGGQSYAKAREQGASIEDAQRYAIGSVAAEVLPEGLTLGIVLKRGRSFIAKAIGATAAEAGQEFVTEAINIGLDQGILDEHGTWSENLRRLKDAGIVGGLVGGGMATGVSGVDAAERAYQSATPARQFAKAMQANVDAPIEAHLAGQIKARFGDPLIAPAEHQASGPRLRPMSELVAEAMAKRKPRPDAHINYGDNAMAGNVPAMASKPVPVPVPVSWKLVDDEALDPAVEAPTESRAEGLEIAYPKLEEIKHSPDLPQFKSGADEDGVAERLGGTYDPRGESPIQVWVRLDGRKEIITGRHRLDLAKRTPGQTTIPAQYYYESDGFDAKQAATLDALLNIREGQGRVKDYIGFIQGAELTRAEADAQGILARSTGQRAYIIATQGSDALIASHANDEITDAGAERIVAAAPGNEAYQAVGIKAIQDGKSINRAVQLIKAVKYLQEKGITGPGTGDLFGFDDSAMIAGEPKKIQPAPPPSKYRKTPHKPKPKLPPEKSGRLWTLMAGYKSRHRSHDGAVITKMTIQGGKPLWLLYAPGESLEGGNYTSHITLKEAKNATPMAYDHVKNIEYPWTPETPSIKKSDTPVKVVTETKASYRYRIAEEKYNKIAKEMQALEDGWAEVDPLVPKHARRKRKTTKWNKLSEQLETAREEVMAATAALEEAQAAPPIKPKPAPETKPPVATDKQTWRRPDKYAWISSDGWTISKFQDYLLYAPGESGGDNYTTHTTLQAAKAAAKPKPKAKPKARRKLTRVAIDAAGQAVGVKLDSLAIMQGESPATGATVATDTQLSHGDTLSHEPGKNFVPPYREDKSGLPARRDTYTINGLQHTTPRVQRFEPIKHLVMKIAGRRVYYRHIRGRTRAGFYGLKTGVIRIKAKNNVETLAHELAHYLDFYTLRDDVPNFRALYKSRKHAKVMKDLSDDAKAAMEAERKEIDKTNLMSEEVQALSYTTDTQKLEHADMTRLVELEGFAEFVRLWLTNSNAAAHRAPKFNDAFNRLLATNPKLQRQMTKLRVKMHNYYYQGPIGRIEAGTGLLPTLQHKWDDWWYRRPSLIRQATIDSGHGNYIAEKELRGEIGTVEESGWKQLRQAKGGYREIALHILNYGTLNWGPNKRLVVTGKSLHDVFVPIRDVKLRKEHKRLAKNKFDLLMGYFKARRALELHKQGRERQIDLGDAYEMGKLGEVYPEFSTIFDDFQDFNDRMLDFYQASGLITAESRKLIKAMNKSYVPFHRIREYLSTGTAPKGGFHRLIGGTANTEDILINIQDSIAENVRAALVAQGKRTTYEMIEGTEDGAVFAAHIPAGSDKIKLNQDAMKAKIKSAMKQAGVYELMVQAEQNQGVDENKELTRLIDDNVLFSDGLLSFWRPCSPPSHGDSGNLIDSITTEDGETRYYEIQDPLLTATLASMDLIATNALVRVLIGFRNTFTRTVTLGLEFIGANIVMDTIGGAIYTKNKLYIPGAQKGYIPFIHSMIGAYDYLSGNAHYQAYIRGGGGGSHLQSITRMGSSRRAISVHEFGVMSIPDRFIHAIEALGSASEMGTRIAESKLSIQAGKLERDAAFDGAQISTDYSVTGGMPMLVQFIRTIHFFNAALQSIDRMFLEFKSKKMGGNVATFMARGVLGVMLPTILLYLFNRQDEAYKKKPVQERTKNWFIPIGKLPNGDTEYFKIPRPYDAGHLFGSLPEIMVEYAISRDGEKAVTDFWWIMGNMFSLDPTPSIAMGVTDLYTNKDWKGSPIVPEHMRDMDPSAQFDARTSQAFYELGQSKAGKLLGISPMQWEHMYSSSLGYLGGYLLRASEGWLWDEKTKGAQPAPLRNSHPAVRRFMSPEVQAYTQQASEFFALKKKSEQVVKTFNHGITPAQTLTGRMGAQSFVDDSWPSVLGGTTKEEKAALYGLNSELNALTKALYVDLKLKELKIMYHPSYSAQKKRDEINTLWDRRNDNIARALGAFKREIKRAQAVAAKRKAKEKAKQ